MTSQRTGVLIALLLALGLTPMSTWAADAYPLFTDPNSDGLAYDGTDVFVFGDYGLDVDGPFAVYNQNFQDTVNFNNGAGVSVPISNGYNGISGNTDLVANSVFDTIGNTTDRLENGNVVRFSLWARSDPANPIEVDPQIQPVLKFEFWKESLSTFQDTASGAGPSFGDKVFDNDQHGVVLAGDLDSKAEWIDLDGDGSVIDSDAASEGRVSSITTEEWTRVEVQYEVDDSLWLGIADQSGFDNVSAIEEVRAVMFFGDFAGTDLTGDGDGGNLLIDNVLVEVFSDIGSVTPLDNPEPPSLTGDFNGDGVTDAADYTVYRDGLASGDFDEADYNTWSINYGANANASAAAVPEPSSMLLLAAASCLLATYRRN